MKYPVPMMKRKLLLISLSLVFLENFAHAETTENKAALADALLLYKKGAYQDSIKKLNAISSSDRETQGSVQYFLGVNHSKLQDFMQSSVAFGKAEKLGNPTDSLNYEYGQSLYAIQHLKEAREQFKKSIPKKYKIAASAYYIAFISQSLDDLSTAEDFFQRIQQLKNDPENVKQPSKYQLAEIAYTKNLQIKNEKVRLKELDNKVLPLYEDAFYFDKETAAGKQAEGRIQEIQQKLDAAAPKMNNGIPIPRKAYTLRVSQDFEYDSNVVTRADESLLQATNQDSPALRTTVLWKYQMNFGGFWSLTPEINPIFTFYTRRDNASIYQNDNLNTTAALRNKFEHTVKQSPATGLLDIEFNYMLRDYKQQHDMPFYSRSLNFIFGERANFSPTGSTTFKVNCKFFVSENPDRNDINPGVSLTQNIKIKERYDLSNTLSADYLHARNDFNDEKNYRLKSSITFTNIAPKIDFAPALSLAAKDTMKQSGTRGIETTFNPSAMVTKTVNDMTSLDLTYDYTKNLSKAGDTYKYTRHDVKITANLNF